MQCDMCGKGMETLVDAIVEGTSMKVCLDCSKFGTVITLNPDAVAKHIEREREEYQETKVIEVIVDNYSELIKKAREKKDLKQEELAKAIAEKESVIHQLESGHLKPSMKLSKKLGVYLGIDLIEKAEQDIISKKDINFKESNLTIADLLKSDK